MQRAQILDAPELLRCVRHKDIRQVAPSAVLRGPLVDVHDQRRLARVAQEAEIARQQEALGDRVSARGGCDAGVHFRGIAGDFWVADVAVGDWVVVAVVAGGGLAGAGAGDLEGVRMSVEDGGWKHVLQ
jgi:hypothetical protein